MPPYAGPSAARTGDVAGTLRLLAYLALAVTLIVLDHRGGWLHQSRQQAGLVVGPLLAVAGWPGRMAERLREDAGTLSQLGAENRRLRNELLVNHARMARMTTVVADNTRLRNLLDAAQRGSLDVQLAPILDIDLDPTRQRLVLDAGSNDGVRVGQSVIDAGGLLGQIIDVTPMHATVLLLTDAEPRRAGGDRAQRRAAGGVRPRPQRHAGAGQHSAVERRQGRRPAGDLGPGRALPARLPGRHDHRAASRREPRVPARRPAAGGAAGPRPRRAAAAFGAGARADRAGRRDRRSGATAPVRRRADAAAAMPAGRRAGARATGLPLRRATRRPTGARPSEPRRHARPPPRPAEGRR